LCTLSRSLLFYSSVLWTYVFWSYLKNVRLAKQAITFYITAIQKHKNKVPL